MRHQIALGVLLLVIWPLLGGMVIGQGVVSVPGYSILDAAQADGIGLVGPLTAEVGQEVTIRMTGTPALNLAEPLIDQLDWLMGDSKMYCYLAAPGRALQPLDVRGELVFGQSGATMQPLLRVMCNVPGEHRILVDWNHGQNQLAEHRITIGGVQPDPDPIPPPPGPLAEMWMIVVEETADRTPEQARVLLDVTVRNWMRENGHHLRIIDKDQKASDCQAWISRAIAREAPALPRLFVADDSGSVVFEGGLPAGPVEFLELSKKYGAEK